MYDYNYEEITKVTIKCHARRHVDVGCDRPIRYIIPYRATVVSSLD